MADVVQVRLERMAEEVEELERRGVFSRQELEAMVRRRREMEFRLKRPSPLKSDFVAYIEYERRVEALREMRVGAMGRKKRRRMKRKGRRSPSEWGGVRRILELYGAACRRFKGDLSLWLGYLEFCRAGSHHARMKQALPQAIRFHPAVPGLWIYAAAWEFDHNLNVPAARALMQSALRCCPASPDLWLHFLRMELTFLNKLRARKTALLPQQGDDDDDDAAAFMPFDDAPPSSTSFSHKALSMLRIIYRGAVQALPHSFHLRKDFFDILCAANLGDLDPLKQELLADARRDFSKDEAFWDWFASLQLGHVKDFNALSPEDAASKLAKAVQVYNEAVQTLPTATMFSFYANFWTTMLSQPGLLNMLRRDEFDIFSSSSLVKVYQQAQSAGCLTEQLACDFVKAHVQTGNLKEARDLAERLCSSGSHFSACGELWGLRVSLELKWVTCESTSMGKDALESILCLVKRAAEKVPVSEAEDLWLLVSAASLKLHLVL